MCRNISECWMFFNQFHSLAFCTDVCIHQTILHDGYVGLENVPCCVVFLLDRGNFLEQYWDVHVLSKWIITLL